MNILKEFSNSDNCSYLDNLKQTTHYKIIENCSLESCQNMIERGYRRFGKMYFRPICSTCQECQSIKIDVNNYTYSKSSKRVIKKAKDIEIVMQQPSLSKEHLKLFDKYHLFMNKKKGWDYKKVTANHYYDSFVDGANDFGYEILYFDKDKLIGVDLVDILDDGISAIYFYYDPQYSNLSLGKLSLLQEISIAKRANKKWIYLGYYVENCPSLSYKADYKPFQTLKSRPTLTEEAIWL